MATPNSGRRSYARRAQYGAFAGYLIAITGVIGGLLAAVIWVVDPVGFGNIRMVVAEATAPVSRVINSGTGAAGSVDTSISAWWRAGSQNAQLRADLTKARRQVIRAGGLVDENRQLRALLDLQRHDVHPVALARLLSSMKYLPS